MSNALYKKNIQYNFFHQVVGHLSHQDALVQIVDPPNDVVDLIHGVVRDRQVCLVQDHEAIDHVHDHITVVPDRDRDLIILEAGLDQGVIRTKEGDTVVADSEEDITTGVPITSLDSKRQGIIIKEVEVVVIIIIGIPGITTETIEEEDVSQAIEVEGLEGALAVVVTEITETEGNVHLSYHIFVIIAPK